MVVPGKFELTCGAPITFQLDGASSDTDVCLPSVFPVTFQSHVDTFEYASAALISSELGIHSWGTKQLGVHLRQGPSKADWKLLR